MKKSLVFLFCLVVLGFFISATPYQIKDIQYSTEAAWPRFFGATKVSVIKQQFPVDKNRLFETKEDLEKYLHNYEQRLISTRNFDKVALSYDLQLSESGDINEVFLKVDTSDSVHFIVVPYPKFSSGNGAQLKLKAKDSNFFGLLNPLSAELSIKSNDDGIIPGFGLDYDFPFTIGNIRATWVNDFSLSYLVGKDDSEKKGFEWDLKEGLALSIPLKYLPLNVGIFQYAHEDLDYKYFETEEDSYKFKDNCDDLYFTTEFSVGTSYNITEFSNYTNLTYSPSVSIKWNWDNDGINIKNADLSSPVLTFAHSLSNGKVTWNNHFRQGYNLSLNNSISWNFHRKDLNPVVSFDGQFFWNYKANDQDYWDRFGINSRLYAFYYFEVPSNEYQKRYDESFDGKLRGIYKDCDSTASAIILNVDLPHNIFTTDFNSKILNFNLQFSPFFDMALVYNSAKDRYFNFEDGYYCAGIEFLVNPLKFSSYTIRLSLGVDLKGAAKDNNFLEAISNNKELSFGLDLHF